MIDEEMLEPEEQPELMRTLSEGKADPLNASLLHVLVKEQVPVHVQHPVVMELLGIGYELEKCIEAAEHHPEDAAAALEYLMEIGEEREILDDSLMDSNSMHSDDAMLFENPAFEQKESIKSGTCCKRYVEISVVKHMIM